MVKYNEKITYDWDLWNLKSSLKVSLKAVLLPQCFCAYNYGLDFFNGIDGILGKNA